MAGKRDIEAGRAFVKLFLKNDLNKQLTGALRGMSKSLKSAGKSMTAVGGSMLKVGAAASLPFVAAIKISADFDDQMRKVQAITGSTGGQFDALREQAKKLGRETAFSASQAAEAMTFLGMAGFSTEQILDGIPGVLSLASAGALELGEAADIASNIAGGFGLAAGEIGHVADVLAQAASSSNTSVQELGEAFAKSAPAARAAGQTLEEAAAAIGIMGDSGVKSSVAGIDLKNMLTKMAQSSEIMGVKTQDASGKMRDILDVMKELGTATAGMSEAEKLSKFIEAFGERSAKSALILSSAGDRIDELRVKMAGADGRAKEMAATMEGGIGGAFRAIMSAAEGVAIEIGDAMMPAIMSLANTLIGALRGFSDFVKENQGLIMAIAAGVAVFTLAGGALVILGTAATVAGMVLSGLASIVGALLSPVGLIAAALVTGAVLWFKYTDSGQRALGALQRVFGKMFATAKQTFGGIFNALKNGNLQLAGEIAFTGLQLAAVQALGAIKALFGETIGNLIGQLASGDLEGAWETTTQALGVVWDSLVAGLTQAMADAANVIIDIWKQTVKSISKGIVQNSIFEKLLGIDKERERFRQQEEERKRLAKRLGIEFKPDKDFDQSLMDSIDTSVEAQAKPLEKVADQLRAASREAGKRRDDKQSKLDETNKKTSDGFADQAEELKKRLAGLTAKAAPSGDAEAPLGPGGKVTAIGEEAGAGGRAGLRGVQGGIPVTFNAAAAIAAGVQPTRAPEEKMVDHLDNIEKSSKRAAVAAERHYQAMIKFEHAFRYGS